MDLLKQHVIEYKYINKGKISVFFGAYLLSCLRFDQFASDGAFILEPRSFADAAIQ